MPVPSTVVVPSAPSHSQTSAERSASRRSRRWTRTAPHRPRRLASRPAATLTAYDSVLTPPSSHGLPTSTSAVWPRSSVTARTPSRPARGWVERRDRDDARDRRRANAHCRGHQAQNRLAWRRPPGDCGVDQRATPRRRRAAGRVLQPSGRSAAGGHRGDRPRRAALSHDQPGCLEAAVAAVSPRSSPSSTGASASTTPRPSTATSCSSRDVTARVPTNLPRPSVNRVADRPTA